MLVASCTVVVCLRAHERLSNGISVELFIIKVILGVFHVDAFSATRRADVRTMMLEAMSAYVSSQKGR